MRRLTEVWPVVAVVACAAALRGWWLIALPRDVGRDGATYARLAENLATGGGYRDLTGALHTVFPPGYPLAVAPLVMLFGDAEQAGRIVSIVSGVGVVVFASVIARRLFGTKAAIYTGLLTAVHPRLVDLSTVVFSESLYTFVLCALSAAAIAVLEAPSPRMAAGLGLGFALLACIRPEGYLVALAAAIALASAPRCFGDIARCLGALFGAMALPVALYSAYLWSVSGEVLTGKWSNLGREMGTGPDGPVRFAEYYLRNLFGVEAALAAELSLVVVVLAAAGMAVALRTLDRPITVFMLLSLALPFAAIPAYAVSPRYLAPGFPLVFVFASATLCRLDEQAARWRAGYAGAAVVLLIFLHGAAMLSYPLRYSAWGDAEMTEHREVGRWILGRYGPGRRILTRAPETVYYARGIFQLLPYIGPAEVVAEARHTGSEFIVLDELLSRRYNPRLLALLAEAPPPELCLVRDFAPHPGRRVRVFTTARECDP